MSTRTTSFTPARSGPLPARTAVVHTLPATRRPGRRSALRIGDQLGVRTPLTSRARTAASVRASRIVLAASVATCCAVVVEAWAR